jgi:cyclohexa-1,5-dienecarbonyl-CoA hydratase
LLWAVLNRPRGNVLTMAMMRALSDVLAARARDRSLRLVVLRGAGGTFSYGASVEEHRAEQAPEMLAAFHELVHRVAGYPVPVAALVEGQCLGGAFELTLCCHLVLAAPDAVFGCPEVKLGVFPPVLAAVGSLRLGAALSERLLLTGETLDAATALRLGFATAVFDGDPEEGLVSWHRERLRPLSAWALRQAVRASRCGSGMIRALQASLPPLEQLYLEEVVPSHDGNEGIAAFLERRKPVWRDP